VIIIGGGTMPVVIGLLEQILASGHAHSSKKVKMMG